MLELSQNKTRAERRKEFTSIANIEHKQWVEGGGFGVLKRGSDLTTQMKIAFFAPGSRFYSSLSRDMVQY